MENPLQFAIQLARQAGQLLLEYYGKPDLNSNLKNDQSLVTAADLAVDQLITDAIRDHYPDDLLLSEETQSHFLSNLDKTNSSLWIIDPLDGSTNFSLGLHFWGVLLARLVDRRPELAVLYFPLIDELYSAQRRMGAFLNRKPIRVQPPSASRPISFFACCSRTHRLYNVSVPYKTRILGSAAYTFCSVARGMAILGFEATPKIWDVASAWLLIIEAGGVIETLDGSQPFNLQPGIDYSQQNYPTLAAATSELITQARKKIRPKCQ